MTTQHAIESAREYAKMFSTDAFAIHHLMTTLGVSWTEAKELFYKGA